MKLDYKLNYILLPWTFFQFLSPTFLHDLSESQLQYSFPVISKLFKLLSYIYFILSILVILFYPLIRRWRSNSHADMVVYDVLYIPIMESLMSVFVCTYTCSYDPSNPPATIYSPLDEYPSIHCNSVPHAIIFIIAVGLILFFHCTASISATDFSQTDSVTTDLQYKYFENICKVCVFFFLPLLLYSHSIHLFTSSAYCLSIYSHLLLDYTRCTFCSSDNISSHHCLHIPSTTSIWLWVPAEQFAVRSLRYPNHGRFH